MNNSVANQVPLPVIKEFLIKNFCMLYFFLLLALFLGWLLFSKRIRFIVFLAFAQKAISQFSQQSRRLSVPFKTVPPFKIWTGSIMLLHTSYFYCGRKPSFFYTNSAKYCNCMDPDYNLEARTIVASPIACQFVDSLWACRDRDRSATLWHKTEMQFCNLLVSLLWLTVPQFLRKILNFYSQLYITGANTPLST